MSSHQGRFAAKLTLRLEQIDLDRLDALAQRLATTRVHAARLLLSGRVPASEAKP